jgi:uncharacterized iron-regulated protein
MRMHLLLVLLTQGLGPAAAGQDSIPTYLPNRVYDSKHKRFTDVEAAAATLARADVVLVGEEHDDPATHRIELALLEAIARRRDSVVVSLEMFERDAQRLVDGYLGGEIAESVFLARARPWPRYRTDYRGLVELARGRRWPVVAANVPRPLATLVSRSGLAALDTLADTLASHRAAQLDCPLDDDYAESFVEVMRGMPSHGGPAPTPAEAAERINRMYFAQCLKDETMAESIARAWESGRLIVHYTGSFHSDFRRGTASRVRRRLPDAKVVVLSVVPVGNLDDIDPPSKERKRADFLIYVLKPPPKPAS